MLIMLFLLKTNLIIQVFFFKIWDQMFGSIYTGETVISAMEARKRGLRTRAHWDKVEKVDYSPLLSHSFWMTNEKKKM